MAQTYAKHLSHSFAISSAINPNTLLHGSHVFFSNLSTNGPMGEFRMLFHELCRHKASLVQVPTPAEIVGTAL
jgi:ABC-type tungstate transport system substrate-binding protein